MVAKRVLWNKRQLLASLGLALGLVAMLGFILALHVNAGAGGWTPLGGPSIPGGQVNALAVHPAISGTVYAAVAPVGAGESGPSVIYKTTDGAASWTAVYTAKHRVCALAVTGTIVYAGAFNQGGEGPSIYLSNDSGVSWTPVFAFTSRGAWSDMAVHPTDTNVAIAGGWQDDGTNRDEGVVYGTDDGGLTWSPLLTVTVPGDDVDIAAVLIHPVTPTLMLAAVTGSSPNSVIYRSEDGGATWPVSVTTGYVYSLAAHASDPQMLYAGGRAMCGCQVLRSTDAGLSWTEVLPNVGGTMAFEPPGTVHVLSGNQLWSSTSDGDPGTWSNVGDFGDNGGAFDVDLGPTPAALYAGGGVHGVFKSTDSGANWDERNNGIESALQPRDIDVDPQNLDKLFAAAECGGGWMTTDGGQTWTQPSDIPGCMGAFAINPKDPNIVYGGAYDCSGGAVLRSEDGGLNFKPVYTATFILPDCSGGDEHIFALVIAPSMTSTVYAAGDDRLSGQDNQAVVVRSLDDGVSWTEVFTLPAHSRVEALAIDPVSSTIVYAGGKDCSGPDCVGFVYRTTDGGDNWMLVFTTTSTMRSIVVDYQKPNVLYVADKRYDVHKSTDGGDTWFIVRDHEISGDPSGKLLAIDPHVPSHVYLGGWGYIAETTDGGQTWSESGDPLNQGTPGMEPGALTVDTGAVTQTLYAGFSGVWAHSRLAPQPGAGVTVTAQASALSAPAGATVTISSLAVDQHVNWVDDGTVVTFATSPVGSFASSTITRTTTNGRASATLTGVTYGAATITVTAGTGVDTLTVDFVPFKLYLPLVMKNY
jgi:photosystem II stability/assembly factor-like uncharacterized protein